jgi:hypothetical protein
VRLRAPRLRHHRPMAVAIAPAGTSQEPKLSLSVTAEYSDGATPSVSELVQLLGVITTVCEIAWPEPTHRDLHGTNTGQTFIVAEHYADPFIVAGGHRGIASWWLDGRPGPLQISAAAGPGWVSSLLFVDEDERQTVISAGFGIIRSWRTDGQRAGLAVDQAHTGWINAMSEYEGPLGRLLLSAGQDGAIRSWNLENGGAGPLEIPSAHLGGCKR